MGALGRLMVSVAVMLPLSAAAVAENASRVKLLKSWFRNSDPATAIPVTGGDSVNIFSSPVNVTCPAGMKCAIEVEVDFGFETSGGLETSAKVFFGSKEVIGGSLLTAESPARVPYHWSYVERVGPGTYPIQVSVIADQTMAIEMYAISIRLHRRP